MIKSYTFGRMDIRNQRYTRDLKIIDGHIVSDWYREGGHTVGVEDVGDILAAAPEVVVFGTGDPGRMKLTSVLKNTLSRRNIEYVEQPTLQACDTFNRLLAEGRKAAGAFHLTC